MTNSIVPNVVRATVKFGSIELDCLQFPDGSYHFYINQLNEVLRIKASDKTGQKYLKPLLDANPLWVSWAKIEGSRSYVKTFSLELVMEAVKIYAGLGNQNCIQMLCGRKLQARTKELQHLYFFLSSHYGCVKIGKTTNVAKRLVGVQTGFPGKLEVFKVLEDQGHLEGKYHEALSDYRLEGEWFDSHCLVLLNLGD